jgi:DNA topoisomerase-1
LEDRRLARIVRKCRDMPGSALFQYLDEQGDPQVLDSGDVNDYLREIGGAEFTAKDFRTWGGTCLAVGFLLARCGASTNGQPKATLVEVVKEVASKLGNKPAACRKYYIHPAVMDCYTDGDLLHLASQIRSGHGNHVYERVVLSLLHSTNRKRKKAA